MKNSKAYFAIAAVFFAIGAFKAGYGDGSPAAFIALGAAFLAIGASRRNSEKGNDDAR